MTDVFAKIKPTEPFRYQRRRNVNCSDSSDISFADADASR
jgi:hypothetical protein